MAGVSFGLNRDTFENEPDQITVGTLTVTTNDVELRWDTTKGLTKLNIIKILESFVRRLEDGRFNDNTNI